MKYKNSHHRNKTQIKHTKSKLIFLHCILPTLYPSSVDSSWSAQTYLENCYSQIWQSLSIVLLLLTVMLGLCRVVFVCI